MDEIIYADVLFIINFSMDYLSLLLCSKISRCRANIAGLVLASAVGALYAVASVVFEGNRYINHMIGFGCALLMCYIAFGISTLSGYLRQTALFYGIGFLLGGAMTALYGFLNTRFQPRNAVLDGESTVLYTNIPLRAFAVLALFAGAISFIWEKCLVRRRPKNARVEISVGAKKASANALCDSGNLLCDPVSGSPVMLISSVLARELLPRDVCDAALTGDISALTKASAKDRLRVIPAHGVGGKSLLIGFKPDRVTVDGEERELLAALYTGELTDDLDAVLPADI